MTGGAAARLFDRVIRVLVEGGVPFLVGGAYALQVYTGVRRPTKDVDLFLRATDCRRALDLLEKAGYRTELTDPVWLGKVFQGDSFLDLIFGSGNGICKVDDTWFANAPTATVLGHTVRLCAPEEMIWTKVFIMEPERYDGADVAHLIRACGRDLDWRRVLDRLEGHWELLLAHLVLYGYIFPSESEAVPSWVMEELLARMERWVDPHPSLARVCRGTLLSRYQYLADVQQWGYRDARSFVFGNASGH